MFQSYNPFYPKSRENNIALVSDKSKFVGRKMSKKKSNILYAIQNIAQHIY